MRVLGSFDYVGGLVHYACTPTCGRAEVLECTQERLRRRLLVIRHHQNYGRSQTRAYRAWSIDDVFGRLAGQGGVRSMARDG